MAASGWMRKWRGARGGERASALVQAAVRGEPLEQLLEAGASALLAAAKADRAGLWLSGARIGESGPGCVVEALPGPIPDQWKNLDISTPFLRSALESSVPVQVGFGPGERTPHLGPLVGMKSAVWIPLRMRNRTIGLAMVARAQAAQVKQDGLRLIADEITLAIQHCRDTRRSELEAEERRAQMRISRAILCGVSADSILPQIARSARHHLPAEFVALTRGSLPPAAGDGWDGPPEWLPVLQQENIRQLCRRVFEEGRESELPGLIFPSRPGSGDAPQSILERVAALPVEVRGETRGILVAGLTRSDDSSEDFVRLESYALLAASALDCEAARKERAASSEAVQQITEESCECLVLIDDEGRLRGASRAASALLSAQWGGRGDTRLEDLFSPTARDAVTGWRRELHASPGGPLAEKGGSEALEARLERGGIIRMHLRCEIGGAGGADPRWLLHLQDPAAEQSLREAGERLEAEFASLLDSVESGVLLLDAEGRIRKASDRLGVIFGLEMRRLRELVTIDSLIDSLAAQLARPAETVSRWRAQVRRGSEASWDEFELIRPSRKIVERFARPIQKPDGERLGWLEVYRDITGQRMIQSKLLQTEKMAALGQLVSGIAHELNNPLTSIQGYAQLLLGRRSPSVRTSDVRQISQEAERAARIVKNLLLFSREAKPERRAVNLNEVVERTLSLRSYELKVENIDVELALDSGLPLTLADTAQLQQVVLNLIVNAEQAIAEARGEESRQGRILIRTRRLAGDRVGLEVADDGPGIPPEIVSRIFDPFFTTKPPGVGTGLGLSIVYGIVQEHGGEVSVESQPGRGATLMIELPALSGSRFDLPRDAAAIERRISKVAALPPPGGAGEGKQILVVEDEPTVARLIADVMAEEGHHAETLLDSREALRRLEEKNYSLLICDLKMPFLDGPALYRALKGRGHPIQHRLLFVTGDTVAPRTLEFLRSSGLPYLAKPFLVEELKEAVRQALATAPTGGEVPAEVQRTRAAARER